MIAVRFSVALGIALIWTGLAHADPSCGLYQYKAVITDVYDGDTVTADIDLGFHVWRHDEKLRLYGIDTPEIRGPDKELGIAARDALADRIVGKELIICTVKDEASDADAREKYGRYLVKIYDGDVLINDWLVDARHARPYFGEARQLFSAPAVQ